MILKYTDNSPEGLARREVIDDLLPKETLIETILKPQINKLYPTLLKMLYTELEIYRKFPKKSLDTIEKAKEALKTFEPRNDTTCFQGKAFRVKHNSLMDGELVEYRKAVGTFKHAEWGDATLLEIWGGDHFKDHADMVKAAFKYGSGVIKTRPVLKFHVNPLFGNKRTGKMKLTDEQKEYQNNMDQLLADAMVYGTKKPKR